VHARICNGEKASLPWKLLRTYLESCASIVQAVVCRPLLQPPLLSRANPSPDAVRSRNPSKSTLAHDAVATAVSHKHHSIICVGAGLIQFVHGSQSRLATEFTHHKNLFPPFFARLFSQSHLVLYSYTLPHSQSCLEDILQEMGISTTDIPTDLLIHAPIHLWFTAPELGHPIVDNNRERPLRPLVGLFLHEDLSRCEGMDDDNDEMGHIYTGVCDTRCLARSMLANWEVDQVVEENDNISAVPDQHLCRSRERFSTPHTARDTCKIDEIELENEDLLGMIRHSPEMGAVWFHHEPEGTDTSHAGVTATTFQGTTSVIIARGPYQFDNNPKHRIPSIDLSHGRSHVEPLISSE